MLNPKRSMLKKPLPAAGSFGHPRRSKGLLSFVSPVDRLISPPRAHRGKVETMALGTTGRERPIDYGAAPDDQVPFVGISHAESS